MRETRYKVGLLNLHSRSRESRKSRILLGPGLMRAQNAEEWQPTPPRERANCAATAWGMGIALLHGPTRGGCRLLRAHLVTSDDMTQHQESVSRPSKSTGSGGRPIGCWSVVGRMEPMKRHPKIRYRPGRRTPENRQKSPGGRWQGSTSWHSQLARSGQWAKRCLLRWLNAVLSLG